MALKIIQGEQDGLNGRHGRVVPVCDFCHKEFSSYGNCVYQNVEDSEVFIVHRECDGYFRQGKPKMQWSPFRKIKIEIDTELPGQNCAVRDSAINIVNGHHNHVAITVRKTVRRGKP